MGKKTLNGASPESWQEQVRISRANGVPWDQIFSDMASKFPNLTEAQFKRKLRNVMPRADRRGTPINIDEPRTTNAWKNGVMESDRLITINENSNITPALMLKLHNLDPNQWTVTSYINNLWHGQQKGGSRIVQYQSKLFAKPITDRVTFADVDAYLDKRKTFPKPPAVVPSAYDPKGEVLEIDIADLHGGLLSWARETGDNYDMRITRKRLMSTISDIINRCKGRKFKKIILALLGDLLHIDNDLQTTTKGTFQQADGRMAKIFEETMDALMETVLLLVDIAPVDVVYTSGNHDGTSGWMLIKTLQMACKNHKNIEVDVSPDPQKVRIIGKTMIGFVHGDMPEKNLSGWLQVKARQTSKPIRFLEVHAGHRHSLKVVERVQTQELDGVVVRTMPTLCSASTWEHRSGYAGSMCTSVSFVWNEKTGLREMWYSNI